MTAQRRNDPASSPSSASFFERVKRRLSEPDQRLSTILVLLMGLIPLGIMAYVLVVLSLTPRTEGLSRSGFEQSTIIYTRNGKQITRFYEENRRWIPLDSIAATVPKALVATEDRRFYEHQGIDIMRTAGAVLQTATGNKQGGSTITMQLVRNLYPDVSDDWDITRKVKEWIAALRMEDNYSKKQILEFYLNTVPFGYNAYGIEAATQTYFNKPAIALDTLQSATLVGMLKGTTLYNPVRNPENARERRNVVLQQMMEAGFLSQAQYDRLRKQKTEMDFEPITPSNNFAPYFSEYVRKWLSGWADRNGYNLYTDGLQVYTTLDASMQKAAESALQEQVELLQNVAGVSWSQSSVPYYSSNASAYQNYIDRVEPFAYYWQSHPEALNAFIQRTPAFQEHVDQGQSEEEALSQLKSNTAFVDSVKHVYSRLQAGFVAMEPQNGMIRAWVGGANFAMSQYNYVSQAKRQPGSTFKPFVYATALANGYQQNDMFRDAKIEYHIPRTNQVWSPGNFGGESGRLMPLKDALANSKNTITSQLAVDLGPSRIADMARSMGIQSELNEVPSLALGTSPVTLLEMVTAYTTLADQGRRHKPVFITRIEDSDGTVIETINPEVQRAVSPSTAYGTLNMMRGVIEGGTGVRMQSVYGARGDLAGKTGTTQDGADGWFMLLHPDLVMGAWMGFNSSMITFRTRYWGQGSHSALRIVGSFYEEVDLSTSATFEEPASYISPDESNQTLYTFASSGLRSQEQFEDSLGIRPPDVDTTFSFGSEDDLDAEDLETVDGEQENDTTGQEGEAGEGESPSNATAQDQEGTSTEEETDEIEEPEPQSEADQRTREARENSQVNDLLDRMED